MAQSGPAGPDGLAVVDKAAGWTSHDVVAKARGVLGTRKVGHSGTLDPDATGVLLLGVGKVTRLLRYLGLPAKTLHGRDRARHGHVDPRRVRRGHRHLGHGRRRRWPRCGPRPTALTGDILQVPPMVSAIQVDGRRLHELAREGIEVERAARPVTVHRFEVGAADGRRAASRSRSSAPPAPTSGRWPTTWAGPSAGAPTCRDLRRTAIGSFTVEQRRRRSRRSTRTRLLSPAAALRDLPAVTVSDAVAADVAHGKVLELERLGCDGRRALAGARRRTAPPRPSTSATAAPPAKPSVVLARRRSAAS